jgi:DNA-directed RNA polymerase subunit RPC12/RpoP
MYQAKTKPEGLVNNIKVRCSGCSATLYVHPDHARSAGGWQCPHCGKRH